MEHIADYLKYFFMSMVPVVELRGSLLVAIGAEGLNPVISYIVCVLGNILPVPFLLFFITPVFDWMKNSSVWIDGRIKLIDSRYGEGSTKPLFVNMWYKLLAFMLKPTRAMKKIVDKLEAKAHNKASQVKKYEMLGLFLFVAIPLPGTGAWTGSLIAAVLGMRHRESIPMVCLGVIAAGLIMTLGTTGLRMLGEWLVATF